MNNKSRLSIFFFLLGALLCLLPVMALPWIDFFGIEVRTASELIPTLAKVDQHHGLQLEMPIYLIRQSFVPFFTELNPRLDFLQYPFLIGLYVGAIVFFAALFQTYKLLSYIDKNEAFSELSVRSIQNIKYCAIIISGLFVLFMPLIYLMAEVDDAPGMILIGMVIIFGSMVIAVFAAVLQKLLKNAIDLKSENDLTV